ncbi:uncharacterized protein L3040_007218 [Drepanopeziza brunnea f. sp. 'multigermtubi']|uniref:uncharacterized protein n=1 Tax=Drepanopeziza brunnea f. sp. 'multigermtubi' TaxID=698441 RepID=UPI00238582D2|nr:hypothetical protein L3040_007218 [Drepanopeziza brunnea f. sp. 'multigermtubi']
MDTALITFMAQIPPHSRSVNLIGSWDNFSKRYPMERDTKRSSSQWRGCYTFADIICDGDDDGHPSNGERRPKRNGGLKMGATYYYYYELDDGTEYHDELIPSTTACPYLPGQPVNLLCVPIEVQPLRRRSASMSSMASGDIKTMNPADKFMTPRAPPPPPVPRLNTSSAVLTKRRSARSLSPKPEKSAWPTRMFFGRRTPEKSPISPVDRRGRPTFTRTPHRRANSAVSSLTRPVPEDARKVMSGDASAQNLLKSLSTSRDPSPLRQLTALEIPDEIVEEAEDDDNFASELTRLSLLHLTPLAPPPGARSLTVPPPGSRSPLMRLRATLRNTSKPLPQLPEEEDDVSSPSSHTVQPALPNPKLPRSRFSASTFASEVTSPTDSHFSFSSAYSTTSDIDADDDMGSGDEFTYSPTCKVQSIGFGFGGYSLPESDYGSEQTLCKQPPLGQANNRATFGAGMTHFAGAGASAQAEPVSSHRLLMNEMGYLGDVIEGKEV